mgnify:FL=1|jgi:hypothetical protein
MSNSINKNQEEFSTSLLMPWIKGTISVDETFLHINVPNTILGLIPSGSRKRKTPISAVSDIYVETRHRIFPMLLGIILALFGFTALSSSVLAGFLMMLIGVLVFGGGIQTVFTYEAAGSPKSFSFPFYEANHLHEFEGNLSEILEKHYGQNN